MTNEPNTACLDGYRLMLMSEPRTTSRYAEQTVFQYARNSQKLHVLLLVILRRICALEAGNT